MNYLLSISNDSFPFHIAQNELNDILYDDIKEKNNINYKFDSEVKTMNFNEKSSKVEVNFINAGHKIESNEFDFVIGCDGSMSKIRDQLGIKLLGEKGKYNLNYLIIFLENKFFVSIHFYSKNLGKYLKNINKQSMLHFVFNSKYGVTVLISYDIEKGVYVFQVPYYPGYLEYENFTEEFCLSLIRDNLSLDKSIINKIDICIKDIGKWKMRNVYADKYKDNLSKIFLLGDSSHQYPPSGGFGLNNGIIDVYTIIWRLSQISNCNIKNKKEKSLQIENLFKDYDKERITTTRFISECANKNFNKFLSCVKTVGLEDSSLRILQSSLTTFLGNNSYLKNISFEIFTKIGYNFSSLLYFRLKEYLKNRNNCISLVHPNVDYGINYYHKIYNDSLLNQYSNSLLFYPKNFLKEGHIILNYNISLHPLFYEINQISLKLNNENGMLIRNLLSGIPFHSSLIIYDDIDSEDLNNNRDDIIMKIEKETRLIINESLLLKSFHYSEYKASFILLPKSSFKVSDIINQLSKVNNCYMGQENEDINKEYHNLKYAFVRRDHIIDYIILHK